jgi:hypothetical protein
LRADSTEYVTANVYTSEDITGSTAEMSFDRGVSWYPASLSETQAKVLVGPSGDVTLARGSYQVLVRIHDLPEVPVIEAGSLSIT